MNFSDKIKKIRKENSLTQEELAKKLNVSRQAIAKWESNKGLPDIANLVTISSLFDISLDELIVDDVKIKNKIISDSSSKKWHLLVIIYLIAIIGYIFYFHFVYSIFMIGFLIATIFMLVFELIIFVKEKIWKNDN